MYMQTQAAPKPLQESQIQSLAAMSEADRDKWIKDNKSTINFTDTYHKITAMKVRASHNRNAGSNATVAGLTTVEGHLQCWDSNLY